MVTTASQYYIFQLCGQIISVCESAQLVNQPALQLWFVVTGGGYLSKLSKASCPYISRTDGQDLTERYGGIMTAFGGSGCRWSIARTITTYSHTLTNCRLNVKPSNNSAIRTVAVVTLYQFSLYASRSVHRRKYIEMISQIQFK